jgi:hypothetical protein
MINTNVLLDGVHMSKFDDSINRLKNLGKYLVPFNYPLAPMDYEKDISLLKKSEVEVDGYSIVMHYNRSLYQDHFHETFQIYNKSGMFLPFQLVVKLGQRVLGGQYLSLVQFYQGNHKVYCWSVCIDLDGKPIPYLSQNLQSCEFEGFQYKTLQPEQLNLY